MCLAMYLITNGVISQSKWSETLPGIWVRKAEKDHEINMVKWSRGKNVYYMGSYEGCGCGWRPASVYDEEETVNLKRADRNKLADILNSLRDKPTWIIVCWEGDQGQNLIDRMEIRPDEIRNDQFEFQELCKYRIV